MFVGFARPQAKRRPRLLYAESGTSLWRRQWLLFVRMSCVSERVLYELARVNHDT